MIGALVARISLEMTRRLVSAGVIAKTLTIIAATNATPIVVTTSAPHGYVRAAHGVVAGVGGNVDANGTWVLTPVTSTTLRLTTFSEQGAVIESAGSGAYTSGGTVKVAFPDGSILLGRRNVAMSTAVATPRIVFVPRGSSAWGLDPYGGVIPAATLPRRLSAETPEQQTMMLQRQVGTEPHQFEVHVTGSAVPSDPDFGDFDVTQALYHTFFATVFDIITNPRAKILRGEWASQVEDIQSLDTRGQKWVGLVEISQPVLPNSLEFVPASTDGGIVVNFINGTSADETIIIVN